MDGYSHLVPKRRYQWSALLLLLAGLCSFGSPHHLKLAAVHHRAPAHSSRTSRDMGRTRTTSSRTSAEAEVEPEIPFDLPQGSLVAALHLAPANSVSPTVKHLLTIASLLPQPPPTIITPHMVCISCPAQDDLSSLSTRAFRPNLGRAPPLA